MRLDFVIVYLLKKLLSVDLVDSLVSVATDLTVEVLCKAEVVVLQCGRPNALFFCVKSESFEKGKEVQPNSCESNGSFN